MCFLKMFSLTQPLLYLATAFKEMFLTLYKAGYETHEFRKSCSPVWSLCPRERGGASPSSTGVVLVLGWGEGRNEEFYSFPRPLSSLWLDGQPWEAPCKLLGKAKKHQRTRPPGLVKIALLWFPRIPCRVWRLTLLLVLCSNDWIISRDITLRGRDENGCQPAREEELKKLAQEE